MESIREGNEVESFIHGLHTPEGRSRALGGVGAFALLLERDENLGDRVGALRAQVNQHARELRIIDLLRQPPRIWIEPLPETHAQALDLLQHLRR